MQCFTPRRGACIYLFRIVPRGRGWMRYYLHVDDVDRVGTMT